MTGFRGILTTRWALGRHRVSAPASMLIAAVATATVTGAFTGTFTSSPARPGLTRQQVAQRVLRTAAAGVMTSPAQAVLRGLATGSKQLSAGLSAEGLPGAGQATPGAARRAGGRPALPFPAFINVRVNDPSLDTNEPDQTTQSETAIAVAGQHVAVGYNDSQQTGLSLTAATSLTGYSYSADGGASFTDGGPLPNAPEFVNLGDPWLASDRSGAMYFSNLSFDAFNANLDVTVARSADGGQTWASPEPVYRPPVSIFYVADKDAIASGPDPLISSRDDLYTTWDDFSLNLNTGATFTGLPVARSTNGGRTWRLAYAKKFPPGKGCSFQQFIGATPIVNHANGALYVVAEKLAVSDPNCTGPEPMQRSEWIFRSTDGGHTFSAGVKIANTGEAVPDGLLFLGSGSYMRDLELPTIALRAGKVYVAWNDRANGGSHIRLATSADGGQTWTTALVTQSSGDEVQPALSADGSGIHLLYYHRNSDDTLDVFVANSGDGTIFTTQRVTTQSSPGTLTMPQFDPVIAPGYMGDYIANVSDGLHQYYAWGDNRDVVTDFLYPSGRNDPDVFFASRLTSCGAGPAC
jgi:hypothetical protein